MSFEPLPEPKPGEFDYGRYLRRRGEHVLLEADFADLTITGRRGGLQGLVDGLRLASRSHLLAGVRSPVAEVLQGMVLGDDEGVPQETIDTFRVSGLLHIMAVSGENVVLLCSMWSFAFALLGIHRLLRTALLLPVVATYVLLTGASPSIVRAGVAGILGLLAVLASRPSDGWLLWLAPAAWLLTSNPNNLFDVSFQLSFAAVAGLLLLARPLTRAFSFLPGPLSEAGRGDHRGEHLDRPCVHAHVRVRVAGQRAGQRGGWVRARADHVPRHAVAARRVRQRMDLETAQPGRRAVHRVPAGGGAILRRPAGRDVHVPGRDAADAPGRRTGRGTGGRRPCWRRRAGGGLAGYVRDRRRWPLFAAATAVAVAAVLLLEEAAAGLGRPDRPTLTFLDVGEGAVMLQVPGGPTVLVRRRARPLARAGCACTRSQ